MRTGGEIYARLWSLSGVGSEFGTLSWERRLKIEVQENKDKQEPRKLYLNRQQSLQASILTDEDDMKEKASMVCHRAAHIPSPRPGKAEGGNVGGATEVWVQIQPTPTR